MGAENAEQKPAEPAKTENLPATRRPPTPVNVGSRGLVMTTMDEMWRFATCVHESGFSPKGMTKQGVMVAMQMGLELGLSPMMAIQNIGVINGKPGIYGELALGIVEESGLCEEFVEWFEHDGQHLDYFPANPNDDTKAVCKSKRKGRKTAKVTKFSVMDAKVAKLWQKKGRDGQDTPWVNYPGRMLMWRARAFNLRDVFPDVLKGLRTREELEDTPEAVSVQVVDSPPVGKRRVAARQQAVPVQSDGFELETVEHHPEANVASATNGSQEEAPKQEEAAPPVDQEKMDHVSDVCRDLDEKVRDAENEADLKAVGAELIRKREFIGEDSYEQQLKKYQARHRELTGKSPAPEAGKKKLF